jgi:WXG100 family type VII secretion target
MANLNVTYEEMTTAASRLEQGQHDIESKLDELKKLVDGLVNGGYVTDRSSKEFDGAYNEFTLGARNVIGGLDGMSRYLKAASDTFRDADEQLARALAR